MPQAERRLLWRISNLRSVTFLPFSEGEFPSRICIGYVDTHTFLRVASF
jgi:hypothetical protein